jgi:hypothetical protein
LRLAAAAPVAVGRVRQLGRLAGFGSAAAGVQQHPGSCKTWLLLVAGDSAALLYSNIWESSTGGNSGGSLAGSCDSCATSEQAATYYTTCTHVVSLPAVLIFRHMMPRK